MTLDENGLASSVGGLDEKLLGGGVHSPDIIGGLLATWMHSEVDHRCAVAPLSFWFYYWHFPSG